jgi:hypothetical protein
LISKHACQAVVNERTHPELGELAQLKVTYTYIIGVAQQEILSIAERERVDVHTIFDTASTRNGMVRRRRSAWSQHTLPEVEERSPDSHPGRATLLVREGRIPKLSMCATHLGRQPPNENAARLERTKQLCDDLAAAQNDTKKCQEVIEQMRPEADASIRRFPRATTKRHVCWHCRCCT